MEDQTNAEVLNCLTHHSPQAFWIDFGARLRQTYMDTFEQVAHNPQILSEQKIDFLVQIRHFRVEQLLHAVAERHGLPSAANVLVENNRCYVMTTAGTVAFTQAYVPTIGEMPKPARFREKHSAMNEISRGGRLVLGDQPVELLKRKEFYGIICHNPVGRRFERDHQSLGMVQFCVPEQGCKAWLAELTFQEIIAAYDIEKRQRAPRNLEWKKKGNEENTGE